MIFDRIGADVGAWVGVGFRVGASVEAGVGGDVSTGVGIGVSVHTPPRKRIRTFVIAGVPPLAGVTGLRTRVGQ